MTQVLFKCKECKFKRYALISNGIIKPDDAAEVIINHFRKKNHTLIIGSSEYHYKDGNLVMVE